jgi:hypothetical protein
MKQEISEEHLTRTSLSVYREDHNNKIERLSGEVRKKEKVMGGLKKNDRLSDIS